MAFMRALKDKIAPGEYSKHEQSLNDQFMVGALDPEIVHVLQTTVPPASLEAASFLRPDVDCRSMFPVSSGSQFVLMLTESFTKPDPPSNVLKFVITYSAGPSRKRSRRNTEPNWRRRTES